MLKRKEYPKELQIKDEVYRIKFVRKFKSSDTLAECDSTEKEIRIRMGQSPEQTLKCLIHEVIHALEMEYRLDLKHKIVYALEDPIYKFIRENIISKLGRS